LESFFKSWDSHFLGGFVHNIGHHNIGHATSYMAKLCAAMFAREKAVEPDWMQIWIKWFLDGCHRFQFAIYYPLEFKS